MTVVVLLRRSAAAVGEGTLDRRSERREVLSRRQASISCSWMEAPWEYSVWGLEGR